VAANLKSLGVQTYLTGVVGRDRAGELLQSLLREKGIISFLTADARPTTEKTRVVSRSQQLLRIDLEDRRSVEGRVLESLRSVIAEGSYDGIIVSDYAKGVVTPEIVRTIRERRIFYAVDPRPVNRDLYRGAYLMTPNENPCGNARSSRDDPLRRECETLSREGKKGLRRNRCG